MDHWRVKMTSAKGIDLMCCDPQILQILSVDIAFNIPFNHIRLESLNVE